MSDNSYREACRNSGKTKAAIDKDIERMSREYGITADEYLNKEMYILSEFEKNRVANELRIIKNNIARITKETGVTEHQAAGDMDTVCAKYDITPEVYYEDGYYKYSGYKKDTHNDKCKSKREKKARQVREYAEKVAEATGMPAIDVAKRIKAAERNMYITPAQYLNREYYKLSPTAMGRDNIRKKKTSLRNAQIYELLVKFSGKDKEAVSQDIAKINELYPEMKMGLREYARFGFYELDPENYGDKLAELIEKVKAKNAKRDDLKIKIKENFGGDFSDLEDEYNEYLKLIEETISELRVYRITEYLKPCINAGYFKEEDCHRIAADMQGMMETRGFFQDEYVSFHFWDKSFAEKAEFISGKERLPILYTLND